MLSNDDSRNYNFIIISKSSDSDICNNIMDSLNKIGHTTYSHISGTNTIHTFMEVSLKEEYKINDMVKQIKTIPNVVDIEVKSGLKKLHRGFTENIRLSDSIKVYATKIIESSRIRIEETTIDNKPQINIYGDISNLTIYNGNVIYYEKDKSPEKINRPNDIIDKIEELEQMIQKSASLDKQNKEKALTITEKFKQSLSKSSSGSSINKHKEKIDFIITKTVQLYPVITGLLNKIFGIS
jgi:hypothetical protein